MNEGQKSDRPGAGVVHVRAIAHITGVDYVAWDPMLDKALIELTTPGSNVPLSIEPEAIEELIEHLELLLEKRPNLSKQ